MSRVPPPSTPQRRRSPVTGAAVVPVALAAGVLGLACGPVPPGVRYSLVEGPLHAEHFDTYALQGSTLTVTLADGADLKALKLSDLVIRSVPVEVPEKRFALEHADAPGVTGVVSLAKHENTELVSEIGVETTDRRVEWLTNLGAAAAAVIPVVMGLMAVGPTPHEVAPFDFAPFRANPKAVVEVELTPLLAARGKASFEAAAAGLQLEVEAAPADAEPFPGADFGRVTSAFLHSACRTVRVTVKGRGGAEGDEVTRTLKVADPAFVQRVAFPPKGSLRMHSECGVSVSAVADASQATLAAVAAALGAQAKAIQEAIAAGKAK